MAAAVRDDGAATAGRADVTHRPVPPLAVGLMQAAPHATQAERTQVRIALALAAARHGYALVETYETSGNVVMDEVALREMEALAIRLDADAVVYAGEVDRPRVEEVAARVRMVVVRG